MPEQGKGNGLFRIGEVAKLFHLSISSLRHYEAIGLVQPEYTDEMTGYRYYSVRQFEALNTIRYLRALDVGLKDIRGFLQHKDLGCMEELLEAQQRTVRQKLAELARIERKIGNRLVQLRRAQSAPLDEVRLEQCPAQRMIFLRADLQQPRSQDLEAPIRQLEAEQQEGGAGLPRENRAEHQPGAAARGEFPAVRRALPAARCRGPLRRAGRRGRGLSLCRPELRRLPRRRARALPAPHGVHPQAESDHQRPRAGNHIGRRRHHTGCERLHHRDTCAGAMMRGPRGWMSNDVLLSEAGERLATLRHGALLNEVGDSRSTLRGGSLLKGFFAL